MKKPGYRFFETSDGSPSVFFTNDSGVEEAMHNRHGALSETDYIYGEGMRWIASRSSSVSLVSVGLGLGYVELLAAALLAKTVTELEITTFEKHRDLVEYFIAWLHENDAVDEWSGAYDKVAALTAQKTKDSAAGLKQRLRKLYDEGKWRIYPELENHFEKMPPANLVLYDAYSKKTSPELWETSLLHEVLRRMRQPAVFCSYSSNGVLKRSLQAFNFVLQDRPGFAGKRESTLAYLD